MSVVFVTMTGTTTVGGGPGFTTVTSEEQTSTTVRVTITTYITEKETSTSYSNTLYSSTLLSTSTSKAGPSSIFPSPTESATPSESSLSSQTPISTGLFIFLIFGCVLGLLACFFCCCFFIGRCYKKKAAERKKRPDPLLPTHNNAVVDNTKRGEDEITLWYHISDGDASAPMQDMPPYVPPKPSTSSRADSMHDAYLSRDKSHPYPSPSISRSNLFLDAHHQTTHKGKEPYRYDPEKSDAVSEIGSSLYPDPFEDPSNQINMFNPYFGPSNYRSPYVSDSELPKGAMANHETNKNPYTYGNLPYEPPTPTHEEIRPAAPRRAQTSNDAKGGFDVRDLLHSRNQMRKEGLLPPLFSSRDVDKDDAGNDWFKWVKGKKDGV